MLEFLEMMGDWVWWVVAALLASLELVVPGIFFIWLSGAAVVVALVLLFVPIGWEFQIALFAIFSVLGAGISWRYFSGQDKPSENPALNNRTLSYVGRVVTVEEAITHGQGKVRVDDTLWMAEGDDAVAGSSVRIIGAEGTLLRVESV